MNIFLVLLNVECHKSRLRYYHVLCLNLVWMGTGLTISNIELHSFENKVLSQNKNKIPNRKYCKINKKGQKTPS
jgi:hypothetical protein